MRRRDLDELGYPPISRNGGILLCHLLSCLYEWTPVSSTTNLGFSEWTEVFNNARMITVMLDRLTRHCTIVETGNHSCARATGTEPHPPPSGLSMSFQSPAPDGWARTIRRSAAISAAAAASPVASAPGRPLVAAALPDRAWCRTCTSGACVICCYRCMLVKVRSQVQARTLKEINRPASAPIASTTKDG